MILPPLDDSLEDKLMIFKTEKSTMPMPTASGSERTAFWNKLVSELPAFVDYLLNRWRIDAPLVSQRYGITHYHHPDVVQQLGELTPETRLLQLIDAEIFKSVIPSGSRPIPWEGTALELEKDLTGSSSGVSHQARQLFSWQGSCGTYLGRLRKLYPMRLSYHRTDHDRKWTIEPKNMTP
jgi:hypothetical protein